MRLIEEAAAKVPNKDLEGGAETHLLMEENEASQDQLVAGFSSTKSINEGTDSLPVSCFSHLSSSSFTYNKDNLQDGCVILRYLSRPTIYIIT